MKMHSGGLFYLLGFHSFQGDQSAHLLLQPAFYRAFRPSVLTSAPFVFSLQLGRLVLSTGVLCCVEPAPY